MKNTQLGLRENLGQFVLLVIVNAFVGGMIGLERTILPKMAEVDFMVAAKTAILSFIIVFGVVKAVSNYFTGILASRFGKKRLLIAGWIIALPVPFILMLTRDWNMILFANVLLGIHQGLCWSSTVMMKIDLVGERQRGLAMGLNEFAGYLAVALTAFLTGWIAGNYGLRPYPFYLGIGLVAAGLLTTLIWVHDTVGHVAAEKAVSKVPRLHHLFRQTTLTHRNLGSVTQAGLVNNLNDGMIWGLLPLILAGRNFDLKQIGIIAAIYPAVWGIGQLATGRMADFFCKKDLLFWGMLLQGMAILILIFATTFFHFALICAVLGWGTAMVYPTFLATVADNTHPDDRAKSLGIFRFWRDLGYAIGAALTGILADWLGILAPIAAIGGLTVISAFVIEFRMLCLDDKGVKILVWMGSKTRQILPFSGILFFRKSHLPGCRVSSSPDIS